MNESAFNFRSSDEPSIEEDQSQEEGPQFGAVDIVEAFTAMRHEWRGQTKESRDLAEQIQDAVRKLQELEAQWLTWTVENQPDDSQEAKQLARLIADADHQLTRAVNAIGQAERNRRARDEADQAAIKQYFGGLNALARWLARPLLAFILEQQKAKDSTTENPAVEGLSLVLSRLRQAMNEHQIERSDALGLPFDGATMNAIGTVDSSDYPPGHVAEQFAPCYHWKGQILRFADVRVAKLQAKETE